MRSRLLWLPIGAVVVSACRLPAQDDATQRSRRAAMVDLIVREGVRDSATLAALRAVPRHAFVPADVRDRAYENAPLPIGYEQTISQPYVVAFMTEQLRPRPGMKVLEVGTGSGYQAAVLARLGYHRVHVRHGDGYRGWPDEAPFDAVIVTAAAPEIPRALLEQLAPEGRLIMPVGPRDGMQWLELVEKDARGALGRRTLLPVRFVPLVEGKR
jgi:protein-L-isoaspartate(D-aspartate) O-methyltransferase